jgi:hypothetical protein
MTTWLGKLFGGPKATGPTVTIRRFTTNDATLSRDDIVVEGEGWLVDARGSKPVRLFEIAVSETERCLITYRATMKSENLEGRAFLEMWCRFPGFGEFFSKGLNLPLKGTTEWTSYETPFRIKKGQRLDLVKLSLAVEGRGKVWIKDVELLKTPR